jgi:hypothetical protein
MIWIVNPFFARFSRYFAVVPRHLGGSSRKFEGFSSGIAGLTDSEDQEAVI